MLSVQPVSVQNSKEKRNSCSLGCSLWQRRHLGGPPRQRSGAFQEVESAEPRPMGGQDEDWGI